MTVSYQHADGISASSASLASVTTGAQKGKKLAMQASITAPFVFYIQSMISPASSQPFPQYNYTTMDFNRARNYLELFYLFIKFSNCPTLPFDKISTWFIVTERGIQLATSKSMG
ncbi:MAG: hypothetical protein ABFR35_11235 [Thermodesulfobacteriota bacterium]